MLPINTAVAGSRPHPSAQQGVSQPLCWRKGAEGKSMFPQHKIGEIPPQGYLCGRGSEGLGLQDWGPGWGPLGRWASGLLLSGS